MLKQSHGLHLVRFSQISQLNQGISLFCGKIPQYAVPLVLPEACGDQDLCPEQQHSGATNKPIEAVVDGTVVASMLRTANSSAYGSGWSFVTSDEIALDAGVATVVNHSNAAVKTSMTVTDAADDGLTVTADKNEATLISAEGTSVADAPKVVCTLTIEGTPSAAVEKVATVTVSFAAGE